MPEYILDGTPTAIRHDSEGATWIITQQGKVYKNGAVLLDIRNKLPPLRPVYEERGLLGLALHPTILNRYYLMYTAQGTVVLNVVLGSTPPDTRWNEERYSTILVLEEYDGQQPVRKILQIKHPGFNHNGKDALSFRPSDGALVWGLGDDGFAYDVFNLSQRDEFIGGKILAIQVDAIPASIVPISRTAELPSGVIVEAKGLRNPISLQYAKLGERELTFLTCPGQGNFEWVVAFEGKGQNFGWRTYEGPERTKLPLGIAPNNDSDFAYHHPFLYYSHAQINNLVGTVITGGRLIGTTFYFMDWQNGVYRCTPNLANLQQAVPFEQVVLPRKLSSYTSLGQEGSTIWVAGILNGKGYAYTYTP